MKSLVTLVVRCLTDVGHQCGVATHRDSQRITLRAEAEGSSFLTITLPAFAQDFEEALDQMRVSDAHFAGFRRNGGLPLFLGGFLRKVFDSETGELLKDPSIDCISAVRQVCYLLKKIEMDPTPERVSNSFQSYLNTENQVKEWIRNIDDDTERYLLLFASISESVFGPIFEELETAIRDRTLLPKHGPGSVSDRLVGNQKFGNRTWTERLEEFFPYGEYSSSSHSDYLRLLDEGKLTWLTPSAEPPVKVISVPKTQKTPRIIAIEPTWMQYIQQALMRFLVPRLERVSLGCIGFRDQVPNQGMAWKGSTDGSIATLDLSEASDRVNIVHLRYLMYYRPYLFRAVMSCRTAVADVPTHGLTLMSKYASMGSALTFPIEAMVHSIISFIGICEGRSLPFTRNTYFKICAEGRFRVYGDDIIVPVDSTLDVTRLLSTFGLKVNSRKSFWTGRFRESCGKDYYGGLDVTPVYIRKFLPDDITDAPEIAHYVAILNEFLEKGFLEDGPMVSFLKNVLKKFIPLPYVRPGSRGLGIHAQSGDYTVESEHKRYQVPLVRAAYLDAPIPRNPLDGYDALLKCFLLPRISTLDKTHLERSGRPPRVRIKVGNVCPY